MNEDLKWLAENVHEWNLRGKLKICAHKRLDGSFFVSWVYPDDFEGYTSAQWQAARDEIGLNHSVEPTEKVWRGPDDGLPPIDTECEASGIGGWHHVKIIAHDGNDAACWDVETNELFWSEKFRPIRSEEDRAVEDMLEVCKQGSVSYPTSEEMVRRLYRAGYRKQEDK